MYQFYFQRLNVWQQSRKLVSSIYDVTNTFPESERFNLTSQIRRSVISIPSNLAEVVGKRYFKDQARYTSISYGSLMELLSLLVLSRDLCYLEEDSFQALQKEIESIARQLTALRKAQLNLNEP